MSNTSPELPPKDVRAELDHTMSGSLELQWTIKFVSSQKKKETRRDAECASFDDRCDSRLAKDSLARSSRDPSLFCSSSVRTLLNATVVEMK